jgi:hypothetical protein
MAKNVLEGKIKNQGNQQVVAPYAKEGAKGKSVKHTGKDLRAPK